jgi:DNA-binding MarR family transcriptional regulator
MTQTSFVQIPFELINYVRSLKLSGTQYDLWLYLYSCDPYGDRFVEIPSPAEIAVELGLTLPSRSCEGFLVH